MSEYGYVAQPGDNEFTEASLVAGVRTLDFIAVVINFMCLNGVSKGALAKRINIEPEELTMWLSAEVPISLENMFLILTGLGISLSYRFDKSDSTITDCPTMAKFLES